MILCVQWSNVVFLVAHQLWLSTGITLAIKYGFNNGGTILILSQRTKGVFVVAYPLWHSTDLMLLVQKKISTDGPMVFYS